MHYEALNDFVFEKKVPKEILKKYENKIPEELYQVWKEYGFWSFMSGYLKIINPDEYQEIVDEDYFREDSPIPLFSTGMGDIIIWEENKYLILLNFKLKDLSVISSGFDFFFEDIVEDEGFGKNDLEWGLYPKAVEKYGQLAYDECFGFVPLLGLGGAEKVENMEKVKLIEHIQVITHLLGPIE